MIMSLDIMFPAAREREEKDKWILALLIKIIVTSTFII